MSSVPTDDDARLAEISADLATRLVAALPAWLGRVARARIDTGAPEQASGDLATVDAAAESVAATLAPRLQRILHADVDAGAGSPLAAIREATGPVNDALGALGVSPPRRDPFAERAFPHDAYDLGPATFRDIHESLHEPGIVWGAARAHVHLQRRAAAGDSRRDT